MQKNIVITGATSGIGLATARALAGKGRKLILVARNQEKGEQTANDIIRENPEAKLEFFRADLSRQKELRALGEAIAKNYPTIDVLINNAGTWYSKHTLTEDGVEKVFAVNHLAYFLLTHLLYPNLKNASQARVINVGSDSHFQGKMHFDDLNLTKKYHGLRSYAQSKLANVLFTYEFDRRKPDDHISIYCLQPGLIKTDIGLKHTRWLHRLVWKFRRSGGVSPEEGAKTQIYLAESEDVQHKSGLYWDKCEPKPSSKNSYREEDAARLWEISKDLCGIKDYFHR